MILCTVHFYAIYIHLPKKIGTFITYTDHLILYSLKMHKIQSDVAYLLTLLMTYFLFGGWRYTP